MCEKGDKAVKGKRVRLHRAAYAAGLLILAAGSAGYENVRAEETLSQEIHMTETESDQAPAEDVLIQEIEVVDPEDDFMLSGNEAHVTDPSVPGANEPLEKDDADLEIFLEETPPDHAGENADSDMAPSYSDKGESSQEKPGGYEPVLGESDTDGTGSEGSNAGGIVFSGGGSPSGGVSYLGGGSSGETEEPVHRQPKLMLVSDSLSGERLMAGEEYEFTAEFQNTNERETIYNLTVTVKSDREDVSLRNAAFYFGEMRPRETLALPVTVSADRNALDGRAALSFELSYENEQGTSYSQTEEMSLEIYQLPQALLEGFHLAPQLYSTDMAESEFAIHNIGKAEIYNVRLEFAAQGLFAAAAVYAGNLEAGSSYEGTLRIYVGNRTMTSLSDPGDPSADGAYGQTSGTLTLLYEDEDGETYRQVQDFSTEILEPQVVELSVEKEEPHTNQWQTAVIVLAMCLFLVIVALLGWRLKKSRDAFADLLAAQEGGQIK